MMQAGGVLPRLEFRVQAWTPAPLTMLHDGTRLELLTPLALRDEPVWLMAGPFPTALETCSHVADTCLACERLQCMTIPFAPAEPWMQDSCTSTNHEAGMFATSGLALLNRPNVRVQTL